MFALFVVIDLKQRLQMRKRYEKQSVKAEMLFLQDVQNAIAQI